MSTDEVERFFACLQRYFKRCRMKEREDVVVRNVSLGRPPNLEVEMFAMRKLFGTLGQPIKCQEFAWTKRQKTGVDWSF